jgi:hypothetical protein
MESTSGRPRLVLLRRAAAAGVARLANLPIARIAAPIFVLVLGWLTVDYYTRFAKDDCRDTLCAFAGAARRRRTSFCIVFCGTPH